MGLWLSQEELIQLTGYRRHSKQILVLAKLKIEFRCRPDDGFPLVNRAQFERAQGYNRRRAPNWAALNGV